MKRSALDQLISQQVLLGDGAMGTMLYQHGVFLNRCFDELNLSDPGLVKKIHSSYAEAGAEFAITQPVFDPDCLFRFLDATKGFRIPMIAGIWPFTSFKNAEFMANEVPGVVVPEALLARMSKAATKEHGQALGIAIAQELVAKIQDRVAGFAVSAPFGNVATALAVLGKVHVGVA